ncbi:hypothetical protein ACSVDE_19160 [Pseudalkalibacillus sp. Hm43]|uniref:hypothetical protein n=1 Tax=Pseudalkalibacillus sp. Hm43 TaxID=3450742 RepID=UPI003F423891
MEDKLKNLDRVMDKAVYQKKRFSDEKKREVMERIREQDQSISFFEKYLWMLKPVLSISVCIFLLVFSVTYILEPPQKSDEFTDGLVLNTGREVTSLPLLNRISNLAMQENEFIEYVTVSKRDRYVSLSIEVVPHSSKSDVRSTIEQMFYKGTELYTGKEGVHEIGAPWNDYTVDITIVKGYDQKGIWKEEQNSAFIRGVKATDHKQITWMDKEKKAH